MQGHGRKYFGESRMKRHGFKYFARRRPPTLWMGSAYQNSTFSEHGKVANILPGDPYPEDGVNMSKFVFSEHVHVKLNGNTKCSNMVANILPANPFP